MLKKSILGILSVFLLIQLTSCSKTIKVVEETYPDGSPKIEKYYIEKSETEKINIFQRIPTRSPFFSGQNRDPPVQGIMRKKGRGRNDFGKKQNFSFFPY